MKGDFFGEHGVQVSPYVGGTAVGEEAIQLGVLEEGVRPLYDIEEELLASIFREAKRMKVDPVSPDMRPEVDGILLVGDDIAEPVLPQGAQPEGRVTLVVLSPHFDGDDDVTPVGEGK